MGLFSNIIPTFLNNAGEWIDRTFNSPIKPTVIPPASGSTPQFAQGEDVVTRGINLIKSQFQKSQEAQQKLSEAPRQFAIQQGMSPEEAAKIPAIDVTGGMLGLAKKVPGEIIKKAPQTIKALSEEFSQSGKGIVESIKNIFKPSKIAQISPKIAPELEPLAQEAKETITLYRAAPKFPSDKFSKGTYFADSEQSARFYSESHYKGDPSDIKVERFTLPKNSVFREPSTGNYILKGESPVKPAISKELNPLATEARKYKSAEEFVKAQTPLFRGGGYSTDKIVDLCLLLSFFNIFIILL